MSFCVQRIRVPLTNPMISVAQEALGGQARQKSVWHISVCAKWTFWQPSVHVQAGQAKGSLSRSSRRSNYYIRSAGEVLELKPLYSCCLGVRGAQLITLLMPESAWQDFLFEKLREAPRSYERLREAPRSSERLRPAPRSFKKLREALGK